ncbi:MAG: hypothetical protein PHF84_04465 [bacterium]|nr:hypothetical protein [bacterium]
MQILKKEMTIPKNHEIRIKIPDNFTENENVEVIIIKPDKGQSYQDKISLLKSAMKDKGYLNDIKEIENDFTAIDLENWN